MFGSFAALVPRITGSISAVSSSLIIYLIYRSKPKLSTIYHRIMFCTSVADIMASTAMALTTLLMPRNDDPYWTETFWQDESVGSVLWRDQTKLGTRQTCAAQGFFFSTGITIMFAYNEMLCVYYACAIAFRMKDSQIRKKIEPFIHGIPLLTGLAPVIPSFVYGFYNPNGEDSWCTLYPNQDKDSTKNEKLQELLGLGMFVIMGGLFVVILICFTLIIWRVVQNGRQLAQADGRGDIQIDERFKAAHRNTRLIISQSLAYTGALILTLIFPIIRMFLSQIRILQYQHSTYRLLTKLMFIFMPLQGFFNFTIFLWHKGTLLSHVFLLIINSHDCFIN
jgi:NADH:ubiquinone oxidoreductase subunit 3 (subunit A)